MNTIHCYQNFHLAACGLMAVQIVSNIGLAKDCFAPPKPTLLIATGLLRK